MLSRARKKSYNFRPAQNLFSQITVIDFLLTPGAAHLQYVLSNADLPYESHQNKISSISKDLE